jgi:lysyl-tRNA synthetase class 1
MDVMLPTLGEERRATYSPFLPIHRRNRPCALRADEGSVDGSKRHDHLRRRADGKESRCRSPAATCEAAVEAGLRRALGGPWRRLRNVRQGPQANAPIYSKICQDPRRRPPEHYVYEMFLDEKGEKISKSKGNGI